MDNNTQLHMREFRWGSVELSPFLSDYLQKTLRDRLNSDHADNFNDCWECVRHYKPIFDAETVGELIEQMIEFWLSCCDDTRI